MLEIKLGQIYMARFSKSEHPVRLERVHPSGGWAAKALTHGKTVRIKDVSQLLYRCTDEEVRGIAQGVIPNRRSEIQGPVYREPIISIVEGESKQPIKKVLRPAVKQTVVLVRLNLLDAAHRVLSEKRRPMTTREIVAACREKQYWVSDAPTPWQSLNAALNRDLAAFGSESRFLKTERGKYTTR